MTDTHAHLYDEAFGSDRDSLIARCREAGISRMVVPAVDAESYDAMDSLCDRYPGLLHPTMGLHPTSVTGTWKEDIITVRNRLFADPDRYIAVGEVGMDLYWSTDFLAEQQQVLSLQASWALELGKPLIIHVRKAYDEIFPVLETFAGKLRGVFHSFEGDERDLKRIDRLGDFCIGAGGVMTYKKRVAKLLASRVPLERIVLETDSPYLAPVPVQGTRNTPLNLVHIIDRLAEIYSTDPATIISVTTRNSDRLFFS